MNDATVLSDGRLDGTGFAGWATLQVCNALLHTPQSDSFCWSLPSVRSFRPNVLPGRYHPVLAARPQVRTHFVSGSP